MVFAKFHANGEMDDPLVIYEFEETVAAIEAEAEQKKTSFVSDLLRESLRVNAD